jgi:hypothetical protein
LNDADDHTVDSALAAWTAVLDGLEAAVGAAESTLQDPRGRTSDRSNSIGAGSQKSWVPPTLTTHLPPQLRARAMDLRARQESITQRLEKARLGVARQLQAVSSVPGIGEPPKAVYLDVKG